MANSDYQSSNGISAQIQMQHSLKNYLLVMDWAKAQIKHHIRKENQQTKAKPNKPTNETKQTKNQKAKKGVKSLDIHKQQLEGITVRLL